MPRIGPIGAVVVAACLAGAALRAWVLASPLGVLDADEAVWGLMARHALDGELSTFYWGQNYGGTQEVLLTALVFAVVGSSTIALKLVPAALLAVACVLVWRIGRRTIGEPAARVAAALLWVAPSYLVWKSVRAHGFYGAALVLTLAVVLLALRLRERPSRLDAAALGLCAGLAWWATPQSALVVVPALAWLLASRRRRLGDLWGALPAALVGALPWLVWNARHDWFSFTFVEGGGTFAGRFRGFFTATLPMILGLRVPFEMAWAVGSVLAGLALLAALAAFGWSLARRRGRAGVLYTIAAAFPLLYAASSFTWLVEEPRYLVLLAPVLALLLARVGSAPWGAAALLAAVSALSVAGLARMDDGPRYELRTGGVAVPDDLGPLLATLRRDGVRTAFAGYWLAWRITFESREEIIATSAGQTTYVRRGGAVLATAEDSTRSKALSRRVRESARPAHVFVAGAPEERRSRGLLQRAGYRRSTVGGFVVFVR
jgi:hypothetical protein